MSFGATFDDKVGTGGGGGGGGLGGREINQKWDRKSTSNLLLPKSDIAFSLLPPAAIADEDYVDRLMGMAAMRARALGFDANKIQRVPWLARHDR